MSATEVDCALRAGRLLNFTSQASVTGVGLELSGCALLGSCLWRPQVAVSRADWSPNSG
jgi:hypothetical protein